MTYTYTTQQQLRAAFWHEYPTLNRKRCIRFGNEREHNTETRVAFGEFLDRIARDGQISEALAQRATL